jgi:hypothetical protein
MHGRSSTIHCVLMPDKFALDLTLLDELPRPVCRQNSGMSPKPIKNDFWRGAFPDCNSSSISLASHPSKPANLGAHSPEIVPKNKSRQLLADDFAR